MDMCRTTSRPEGLPGGLLVAVWVIVPSVLGLKFLDPPVQTTLDALTETPTRLPCMFQTDGQRVVQVSWSKEGPEGSKDTIIAAHHTEGQTEYGRFSGRVYFENSDPMVNSALMIRSTEESDEGKYTCHVATFPSGNFDIQMSLKVWTRPISNLEPVAMVEGQSFSVAATCRAVARPMPRLSWDTDLPGQIQNRSSEAGSVSTYFSLHPLRSMNGKKLDCLVWHPTLKSPRRIRNSLVVHFPPDATISGYDGHWHAGLEQASLRCSSRGNPAPKDFTWSRNDGPLPEGVTIQNNTLVFGRPLTLEDGGRYHCIAKNQVGVGKADVEVTVSEFAPRKTTFDSLMMIIASVVIGLLVLVMVISVILVNHYHKRKNKKLELELSEKKEEISTLSRQASFRRMHTISNDHNLQIEECVPLRVEGTIRSSLSSLGDQGRCRDSHSTLSGGRGVDPLGRPIIFNTSRRGERVKERDLDREIDRDESLLRVDPLDSHLQPTFHPPLNLSLTSYERTADLRPANGKAIIPACDRTQHTPLNSSYPPLTDEEEEEDQSQQDKEQRDRTEKDCDQNSKTNSSQISESLSNNFHYSNGILRPKPLANAILIHPKGQIV